MNDIDIQDRVPPCDIQNEAVVLAGMLLNTDVIEPVREVLDKDAFYRPAHGDIYAAICTLADKREPVNIMTVRDTLKADGKYELVGGDDYIEQVAQQPISDVLNAIWSANQVLDKSKLRQVIQISQEMTGRAYAPGAKSEDVLSDYQQRVYELTADVGKGRTQTAAEAGRAVLNHSEQVQRGEIPAALSLGFSKVDAAMGGGVRPGQLCIVAGMTSVGKSSLATKFALNVASNQGAVKFFTAEMSNAEVAQRIIQIRSGVNGLKISNGRLSAEDWSKAQEAQANLEIWDKRFELTDQPMTVPAMETEIRRMSQRCGTPVELVIVDYLQIVPSVEGKTIREKINSITGGLKQAAKLLNVPILLLSQLNRTSQRETRPPELWDLKESSNIEQDADAVILLHRPADSETGFSGGYIVWAKLAKCRSGMATTWTGDDAIRLTFTPSSTNFVEQGFSMAEAAAVGTETF